MDGPVNIDHLPFVGATLFGCRVIRLRVDMEDGRTHVIELPAEVEQDNDGDNKTNLILDVLATLSEGERLPGKALSLKAGVKWNSNTRTKFSSMVRDGLISHDTKGYGLPTE